MVMGMGMGMGMGMMDVDLRWRDLLGMMGKNGMPKHKALHVICTGVWNIRVETEWEA